MTSSKEGMTETLAVPMHCINILYPDMIIYWVARICLKFNGIFSELSLL